MPSKKQRAKKPGSKAAQEKVAEECRSGFAWAKAEDDAEQWVQRQLQKERESASRGCCVPPVVSRDESPAGDRAEKGHDKGTPSGGGLMQHAVASSVEVNMDRMHNAAICEMKVHMPAHQSMAHDEINEHKTPMTHKGETEVRSERKIDSLSISTCMDPGTIVMKGLLKEHGLATVPAEWNTPMGRLLLKEVLQTRMNKLKKARAQRERRKGHRHKDKERYSSRHAFAHREVFGRTWGARKMTH